MRSGIHTLDAWLSCPMRACVCGRMVTGGKEGLPSERSRPEKRKHLQGQRCERKEKEKEKEECSLIQPWRTACVLSALSDIACTLVANPFTAASRQKNRVISLQQRKRRMVIAGTFRCRSMDMGKMTSSRLTTVPASRPRCHSSTSRILEKLFSRAGDKEMWERAGKCTLRKSPDEKRALPDGIGLASQLRHLLLLVEIHHTRFFKF